MTIGLARQAVAELIGTFALVFAGCGAIIANAYDGALGSVGVSARFGLVIMVMIYATGHLSGAHINPAVTIAFTLTRHFRRATRSPTSPRSSPARRSARAGAARRLAGQARRISARPCRGSPRAARSSTRRS